MTYRTILLCIIAFFASLGIDAQRTKTIYAVIEDVKFLCILETIDFYPDSTIATWKLKSKTRTSKFKLSEHVSIKEIESGIRHKQITAFKDLQEIIRFKKRYEIKEFKTCFPAINDSALISIYLSPTIHVDSLNLKSENLFYEVYKFRVPLFNHQPLRTRADSIKYSNEMYNEGVKVFRKGNFQLAIILFEKSMALERQLRTWNDYFYLGGEFNEEMWIANCYYQLGEIEEAKKYSNTYYVEPYEKRLRSKVDSLSIMSGTIYDQPKLNVLNEICVLDSLYIGGTSFRFAESLYNLGCQYSTMRKFQNAKHIFERAKNIITERYKEKNWLLSFIYKELASISYNENDIVSAIRYMKRCLLEGRDTIQIIDDSSIASNYNILANYYSQVGDWDNALRIMSMRVDYWHRMYLKNPEKALVPLGPWMSYYDSRHAYSDALSDYASFYADAGLPKKALRKYNESINARGKDLGWPEYEDLGNYYKTLRDYDNALRYYNMAADDYQSYLGNNFKDFLGLDILNSMASAYASKGDINMAISFQRTIVHKADSLSKIYGERTSKWSADCYKYADYISNLARFYNLNHQYDSALVYEKKGLEIKKIYRPIKLNLAYSYMNLGYSYAGKKMWDEALKFSSQACGIYNHNKDGNFYLRSLTVLSNCYFHLYRYTDLERSIYEMMDVARNSLYSTIQELTYDERSRFIDEYSDLMNREIPMYAYYTCSDSIIEESYNASLIMKGALLKSENSVKRVINESDDESLKDMWDEMKSDRYILSKELEKDSLDRKLNLDSLQNTIYNLEDSIIIKCKEYGDITQSMKLKWQDVKKTLHSEDVAIEFLSFPINNDSVMYVALTLRKESKSPKMITLFEEKQLKNVPDTLYYQCKAMTDLVWGPLLPELKGMKNIYFSPTSALYNIGVEYLPGMEDYNIFRLSSTRELVANGEKTGTGKNAVLYGGLDYNASIDSLTKKNSLTVLNETFKEHAEVRGLGLRGGKEPLEHTKIEVDKIGEELSRAKWVCLLDTASLGTEESFKSLSGRKINCLHISTHGFYYTKEEADNAQYKFMLLDDKGATTAEDKALTRSGLVLSGANHILEGETLPDNVEDGILTAKEIADVDLRGLDLVVLSACQTGLGDISQGEGVFGLQRGFKKAGANTILMSLWEVNDEATQILMTQFYKNIVSGRSKRQSLQAAQKYLREYNNGFFNEPKYWAAFILLDGIN